MTKVSGVISASGRVGTAADGSVPDDVAERFEIANLEAWRSAEHDRAGIRSEPGPVDGFDQDQSASKCYKSGEAFGGFLTTHCNALEPR